MTAIEGVLLLGNVDGNVQKIFFDKNDFSDGKISFIDRNYMV